MRSSGHPRAGFIHEFRPLRAAEVWRLLQEYWIPAGVALPNGTTLTDEGITTIVRVTGSNFSLLYRLFVQVERILDINELGQVTYAVVEAARESLVIGQG